LLERNMRLLINRIEHYRKLLLPLHNQKLLLVLHNQKSMHLNAPRKDRRHQLWDGWNRMRLPRFRR